MIIVKEELCPKNHHCPIIKKCPVGAITQKNPYSAPEIDRDKCIECGICSDSCNTFQCVESQQIR